MCTGTGPLRRSHPPSPLPAGPGVPQPAVQTRKTRWKTEAPPTRTPGVSGGPPCCPATFSGVFLGAGLPESRTHGAALLPQLPLTLGKAMSRGSTGPPNDRPESHGVARHGQIQHRVTDRRKRWLQSTGPRLGVKFSHRILAKSKDI